MPDIFVQNYTCVRPIVFILFSVFIVCFYIACSKDKPSGSKLFQQLQSHIWVLDSERTINMDGSSTMNYPLSQVEWTTVFKPDTLLYCARSSPNDFTTIAYAPAYESPNKVYFWRFEGSRVASQFLVIDSLIEHRLVYHYNGIYQTVIQYYHSK
jgi:hypothetical protein